MSEGRAKAAAWAMVGRHLRERTLINQLMMTWTLVPQSEAIPTKPWSFGPILAQPAGHVMAHALFPHEFGVDCLCYWETWMSKRSKVDDRDSHDVYF